MICDGNGRNGLFPEFGRSKNQKTGGRGAQIPKSKTTKIQNANNTNTKKQNSSNTKMLKPQKPKKQTAKIQNAKSTNTKMQTAQIQNAYSTAQIQECRNTQIYNA